MRNQIALTSLCLLLGLTISAQNGSKWKIGVKAGVNYTEQWVSKLPKTPSFDLNEVYNQRTDWLLGLHIGLSSSLQLSEKFTLNADLLYNQRGFKGDVVDTSLLEIQFTNRLHNISLPLYGNLQLLPKLGFEIGAEASYLVGLSGRYDGERVENLDKNNFSDLDFGLIGGLSYQFHQRFRIQGRYYWGKKDIYDVTFTDINGEALDQQPKYINHGVQLSLTVFPF